MKTPRLKKGDKLKARNIVRYFLGQSWDDRIERNEVVTVDKVLKNGKFTVVEHADRYGPWLVDDFVPVAADGKHLRKGQYVCFDGKWGTVVDTDNHKDGLRTIYMVQIEFESGTKSWEVEDDDKMGWTPEKKAKIDKLVQVIKSAKNPRSEFYKTINHLLK